MNATLIASLPVLLATLAQPALETRENVIDCGEVRAGMPLSRTFALRNRGPEPIHIYEVAASCGCLKPKLSRTELAPGESAELTIDVNTLSQIDGPSRWNSTVRYQSTTRKGAIDLQIKAVVVREVAIEPVALGLTIDGETSHTFTLTDRRAKPLSILAARTSSTAIKTQITSTSINSRGERIQQVRITILDTFPPGRVTETLTLVTDDEQYRELRVPITINRGQRGEVRSLPNQIDLRLARGQTTASGLVRLRDGDDRPVVVDRLESDHPALRTKWAAGPGSMATLRLGVETDGKSIPGHAEVKVYIKEPKPQVLVIPVTWQD